MCPYVHLRVKGAACLSSIVNQCLSQDVPKTSVPATSFKLVHKSVDVSEPRNFLSIEWLEDWLLSTDTARIMVGEESAMRKYEIGEHHIEVFKRSEVLLGFLALRGRLSADIVETLCEKCSKRHSDSFIQTAHSIVSSIIPKVEISILRILYARLVVSVPLDDVDLSLVKSLAIAALVRGVTEEEFGIQIIWRLARVKDSAREALAEILSLKAADFHLKKVLGNIFGLITSNDSRSSFTALMMLRTLLQAQSGGSHVNLEDAGREETIVYAEERHHLKELLLHGIDKAVTEGEAIESIEARLSLFGYLHENSCLEISYDELILLWTTFRNYGGEMSERFFKWLAGVLPGDPYAQNFASKSCFSDETLTRFFGVVLRADPKAANSSEIGIDFRLIGLAGYVCTERLFRLVNGRNRAISHALNKQFYVVETDNFMGISSLLRCVVESCDSEVVALATAFLVDLQCHLSPSLNRLEVWSNFVRKCMGAVTRLTETEASDRALTHTKISRVMTLVLDLLAAIKKPMPVYNGEFASDEVKVTVYLKATGLVQTRRADGSLNEPLTYVFKRQGLTIGSLRSRLASDLSQPAECVKLVLHGQVLTLGMDSQDLDPHGRMSQVFLEVITLDEAEDDVTDYVCQPPCRSADEDPASDQMQLKNLLSVENAHFDMLFILLSCGDELVARLAWQLLELIPINPAMRASVLHFEQQFPEESAIDWSQLLDDNQPFHLLYRLRIINAIVVGGKDAYCSADAREEALKWQAKFLSAGGLNYISKLLISIDLAALTERPILGQILASILQLIELFVIAGDRANGAADDIFTEPIEEDMDERSIAIAEELSPSAQEDAEVSGEVCGAVTAAVIATPHVPMSDSPKLDKVFDVDDNHVELDWVGLAEKLLSVTHVVSAVSGAEGKDENSVIGKVLHSALEILVWMTRSHPSLVSVITNFPHLKDVLLQSIFQRSGSAIRAFVSRAILELCTESGAQNVASDFLKILLASLSEAKRHASSCSEYFSLIGSLVAVTGSTTSLDFIDVLLELVESIVSHEPTEVTDDDDDLLLQGMLSVTRVILMSLPSDIREGVITLIDDSHNLLHELFFTGLFPNFSVDEPHIPKPKCKSPESRSLAFNLLLEIIEGNSDYMARVISQLSSLYSYNDFDLKSSDKILSSKFMVSRPQQGYAGLGALPS